MATGAHQPHVRRAVAEKKPLEAVQAAEAEEVTA